MNIFKSVYLLALAEFSLVDAYIVVLGMFDSERNFENYWEIRSLKKLV